MLSRSLYDIFRKGSRTFFFTSLAFPPQIREDVFILYGFVRKADNFVDHVPQQADLFYAFRGGYEKALRGKIARDPVINNFVGMTARRFIRREWVEAFLDAMETDIRERTYRDLRAVQKYMYGSAEVVGLMMARIMGLKPAADRSARYLGRAMQYINFIRDIREDLVLGRVYLPQTALRKFGLLSLDPDHVAGNRPGFANMVRAELDRFENWRRKAEDGFRYIPAQYLISVHTASDMYRWTADQIRQDPFAVYRRKLMPPVRLIKERLALHQRDYR